MRFIEQLLNERLEDIAAQLRKTNGEYARAYFKRRDLFIEIDKIISRDKEISLSIGDIELFKEYFEQDFKVNANWEVAVYHQGIQDAITLLRDLEVLR